MKNIDIKKPFTNENVHVSNFFYFQQIFLKSMAQWPISNSNSRWYYLFQLYEIIMIILPLHLAILHGISVYFHWDEGIDSVSDFITSIIIYSFSCFATTFFIVYGKKLQKLVLFMNENFRLRSAKGLTYISIEKSFRKAKLYSYIWTICCSGGVILWALYPLMVQERSLPLRCWYPFDEKQPIVYEILYAMQFFAQIQVGVVFANGSAVYFVLIILVCGQYDILFCSFKNIMYTADLINGNDIEKLKELQNELNLQSDELNQYYCGVELLDNLIVENKTPSSKTTESVGPKQSLQKAMKQCVQHHQAILNVCHALEDFFHPFCLIKSLQITFQLCFLVFISANQTSISILRSINLLQYLGLTGTELVLFTYFGETLRIQSLRVGEALLRSPWFTRSVLVRKEILIVLPNALRAVELTAGKFYPMNVECLRSVVAAAFSYYTLLQTLKA